mgnify:CR=1 FL=1
METLENVVEMAKSDAKGCYDEIVSVESVSFEDLSTMYIGSQRLDVLPAAKRLISGRLKVPQYYLERCPKELQAENLNYWIRQESKKRKTLFMRMRNAQLRAVFTDRYIPVDNVTVLDALVSHGADLKAKVHVVKDENLFMVRIPDPKRGFNIRTRDRIVPGISITNSEVGYMALCIEAFFLRLVCTNGLITQTLENKRLRHTSEKALENFTAALSSIASELPAKSERLSFSGQSKVDDPESSIEAFGKRFLLTQEEIAMVQSAYFAEPGKTMMDIINAFTLAAQANEVDAPTRYKLERAGGNILELLK